MTEGAMDEPRWWGIWFLGSEDESEGWCCLESHSELSVDCLSSEVEALTRISELGWPDQMGLYVVRELPMDSDCVHVRRLIDAIRKAIEPPADLLAPSDQN
jgi:hypothetical protein